MSGVAQDFIWSLEIKPATRNFILLSLASHANDEFLTYPSQVTISKRTGLNIKTVQSEIDRLVCDGAIIDTGRRMGVTLSVVVYRLNFTILLDRYKLSASDWHLAKFKQAGIISQEATPKLGTLSRASNTKTGGAQAASNTKIATTKTKSNTNFGEASTEATPISGSLNENIKGSIPNFTRKHTQFYAEAYPILDSRIPLGIYIEEDGTTNLTTTEGLANGTLF